MLRHSSDLLGKEVMGRLVIVSQDLLKSIMRARNAGLSDMSHVNNLSSLRFDRFFILWLLSHSLLLAVGSHSGGLFSTIWLILLLLAFLRLRGLFLRFALWFILLDRFDRCFRWLDEGGERLAEEDLLAHVGRHEIPGIICTVLIVIVG